MQNNIGTKFIILQSILIVIILLTTYFLDPNRISPKFGYENEYSDAYIHCRSQGYPTWTFNNESLPHNALQINHTILKLSTIDKSNKGVYECKGLANEINQTIFYAKSHLTIIG